MRILLGVVLAMLPVVKPTLERRFTQMTPQDSLIVEEWKKTIMEKRQPLNIDSLTAQKKVLIFGENHEKSFQRYFLASNMTEFYKRGYSCLCVEMPSDLQEKLHFMRMIVKLRKMGAEVSQGEEMFLNFLRFHYSEEMALSMYALIDAAYSTGMEVYAIDVPSSQKPPPYNYPAWLIDEREEYMTKRIGEIMQKGEKPIVLVGMMHYRLAGYLDGRFVSFPSSDSLDYFYKAVEKIGIKDTFMIQDGRFSTVFLPDSK